ncbi:transcription factor [Desulfosporosinus acidiphilus SJ4]|uniref:Transcription factor n=1 Tax=Desulfosporosinus acidiphilus (strain DSM 22704 / JCM 16185 / SJ4) TaxID=646529 RepID=I4D0Q8_DESAJ|nr:transcription factor [Desulfosporosinus acidiphilus]AFM39382.1 transcription factor [Desulfosporosinus acidiphilus SJ4]
MTTLEQVEKLCTMANISYEEAKAALDAANGDLLEAIIYLEKQGKITAPTGDGYYSSKKTIDPNAEDTQDNYWDKHHHHHHHCHGGKGFFSVLKKIGEFCFKMIRKGNTNFVEVLKGDEIKASFPVTVLALLLIFAFWVTIPLIIIGLFFGLRYRFKGSDLGSDTVNKVMKSAAEAAEHLKKSIDFD